MARSLSTSPPTELLTVPGYNVEDTAMDASERKDVGLGDCMGASSALQATAGLVARATVGASPGRCPGK